MKEIGGYLEFEKLINNPYYKDVVELNTGRNALIYLMKIKEIDKLYIPYFLCDSIANTLERCSIKYEYYYIDKNFIPVFEKELGQNHYLYIVNYYGQICNKMMQVLKEKYKNIILDNTQAFFQKPAFGIDTIYSCRKFFGIPDGAYLYTTSELLNEHLKTDTSRGRLKHLLGRLEGQASDYYKNFQNVDESFNNLEIMKMSHFTKNILGAIDYEKVKQVRNDNFQYLHSKLKDRNVLNISVPDGPFAYPYYAENGIELRKILANKKIYVPTLWPNVLNHNDVDSIEYNYTANILPIPCDQRYTINDMKMIIREVLS